MPIACRHKTELGRHFCVSDCPASAPCAFQYARVESPDDLPPADDQVVDVAVLDLNHGWPNLGHDSLVHAVLEASCDLLPRLTAAGLALRVVSFAVRDHGMLPEPPGGRFSVYLGTGGPGHLDPHCNDGLSPYSQGIREDPSWEAPAFALFDAIAADPDAALLAVCHTFGVLCRWSGAARPVLRGPEKGGKLTGVLENVLTDEARAHPWFRRLAAELPGGRRLRILDNRLFDLIPEPGGLPHGFVPIGFETDADGTRGEALTMLEMARDRGGVVPRIFGVNHHPEIVDRARQRVILDQKLDRGEVSAAWVQERLEALTTVYPDEDSEVRLHLTSDYTLLAPLRFHLYRQLRLRAEALGRRWDLAEESALDLPIGYNPVS
jgi:hypothetical protein